MKKSILVKLIAVAFVIITALISGFGVYDYFSKSNELEEIQDNTLDLIAYRLQLNLPPAIWNYENALLKVVMGSEVKSKFVSKIRLLDKDGKVMETVYSKAEGEEGEESTQEQEAAPEEAVEYDPTKMKIVELTYSEEGSDKVEIVGKAEIYIDHAVISNALKQAAFSKFIQVVILDIIVLTFLFILTRSLVMNPMLSVVKALEDISEGEGDLTARIEVLKNDEIGALACAFNVFVEKIQTLVCSIQNNIVRLTGVAEMVNGVAGSTQGQIDAQRHETDQVATAVTEMAATAKEIASNAHMTAEAAENAKVETNSVQTIFMDSIENIRELSTQLNDAAGVMDALENDVAGIVTVLDVIRGIAEQTNLLALNAAIEAARAGEQGRGFAVVADEVRALASRTAESTAEIQNMIQRLQQGTASAVNAMRESQQKSEISVTSAMKSGESLDSIVSATNNITDMTAQIAAAVEEQTAVSEELNRNISAIVDAADATSQLVTEMSDESENLSCISRGLDEQVGRFKIQ